MKNRFTSWLLKKYKPEDLNTPLRDLLWIKSLLKRNKRLDWQNVDTVEFDIDGIKTKTTRILELEKKVEECPKVETGTSSQQESETSCEPTTP